MLDIYCYMDQLFVKYLSNIPHQLSYGVGAMKGQLLKATNKFDMHKEITFLIAVLPWYPM